MGKEELFRKLEEFRAGDLNWQSGRAFGMVFNAGKDYMEVGREAFSMFLSQNGLDFTEFKSTLRFETELIAIGARHLGGDERTVGNFTSGGTESIMLAVKAARDFSRARRPEIREPEIILPITAHAAFHKAARYLNLRVVQVPVDPKTCRAEPDLMKAVITPNTIMLVGSAPSFSQGVIDPIARLGDLALKHGLLLHVDACMGGFLLPYYKRLGEPVPDFDFSVPGVTSISMDLHKYAYTPFGASLVLYRDKSLRKYQLFACAQWTGYAIVNNGIQSTKSCGPLAAAWAVLNYIGDDGYLEITRKKIEAVKKITAGIEAIDGLYMMARPEMCILAFTSDTINVFKIIEEMKGKGWYIQPAFAYGSSREHIHMTVNYMNTEHVDAFLADLSECVKLAEKAPPSELATLVRNEMAGVNPSDVTDDDLALLLGSGSDLPGKMSDVNEILNGFPPELRERLLIEYLNNLFVVPVRQS
jgi:glutamate/tyrosine decarboxylase-like PLP-dependent enzyme